jgi:2-dehydropantoate 2-reductase
MVDNPMNIVIVGVGAGAVGGYFGEKMVKAGISVTFFVKEKRYQLLKEHGLRIHSVQGDFSVHPKLAKWPEEVERPEMAILAVKTYHLDGIFPALDLWVAQGSKVVPLLNGVEAMIDRLV